MIYQCRISEGITFLTWVLPDGSGDPIELEFEGINTNINSSLDSSDGKFSAFITERVGPVDRTTSRFMMTSTLTVQPPLLSLNGTTVKCRGPTNNQIIINVVNITLSGRYSDYVFVFVFVFVYRE